MSRYRLVPALALLGILITTGGCANSATAPEAASPEASLNRESNPSQPGQGNPNKPTDGDEITIQSGYLFGGG